MNVVYLFPGQGSQALGMGRSLCENFAAARAVFEQAEAVLGLDLRQLCWEGPEEKLRATENAQVALFVCSMAALRALEELDAPAPNFVAGHSLGEYSAACAAGALDFESTLKLVRLRGELMARAEAGTMAAVLGMEAEALEALCRQAPSTAVVANYNAADQLVVSGTLDAVAWVCEAASAAGAKRVIPLSVSGAFHSPLMAVASQELSAALARAPWRDARVPVIANVDARPTQAAGEFSDKLARQLSSPVRWSDTMAWLQEAGPWSVVEVGSGKVLCGLAKKVDRKLLTLPTEDADAVGKVGDALKVAVTP